MTSSMVHVSSGPITIYGESTYRATMPLWRRALDNRQRAREDEGCAHLLLPRAQTWGKPITTPMPEIGSRFGDFDVVAIVGNPLHRSSLRIVSRCVDCLRERNTTMYHLRSKTRCGLCRPRGR